MADGLDLPPPYRRRRWWTRKAFWIPCSIATLLIITAVVTCCVLFLIERPVTYQLVDVRTYDIQVEPTGFILPLDAVLETDNENYFGIQLQQVIVQGRHPSYAGILMSGSVADVKLRAKSKDQFTVPLTVSYNYIYDQQNVYLNQVLDNCTNGVLLYMEILVTVNYKVGPRSGTRTSSDSAYFPCPVGEDLGAAMGMLS